MGKQLRVEEQVALDSGIPDLLLACEDSFVVVEVKTKSHEHDVGETQEKQTIHYPREVRKGMHQNRDVNGHAVFLTEAGDTPENGDAVPTTFTVLALAILEAIEASGACDAEAWPYFALATHWIDQATPGVLLRKFVVDYSCTTEDHHKLLEALPDLDRLMKLVPMKGKL
jgi:hypothetical protein